MVRATQGQARTHPRSRRSWTCAQSSMGRGEDNVTSICHSLWAPIGAGRRDRGPLGGDRARGAVGGRGTIGARSRSSDSGLARSDERSGSRPLPPPRPRPRPRPRSCVRDPLTTNGGGCVAKRNRPDEARFGCSSPAMSASPRAQKSRLRRRSQTWSRGRKLARFALRCTALPQRSAVGTNRDSAGAGAPPALPRCVSVRSLAASLPSTERRSDARSALSRELAHVSPLTILARRRAVLLALLAGFSA